MAFYHWSQTAASNANADPTVNFAEGQAPSSLNDSSRAAMASLRKWGDDISGAIVTGGTSTAFTVTSNSSYDTLAHLNNQIVAFFMHATNGGACTLNVDGLGAKPLRSASGVDLPAGTLIQNTPYVALYNNSSGEFYLHGFFGNPYGIPIGASVDFWGTTAPNSSFVLMYGQAISRTAYPTTFSLFGTTFGSGDGSTTFNIPDCRGRIIAGKDDMGGSAASRLTSTYFGTSAATLGAAGGSQSHTLTLGELPTGITSANASQSISVTSTVNTVNPNGTIMTPVASGSGNYGFTAGTIPLIGPISSTGSNSIGVTSNNTSGNAHSIVPPTIIANKLLRIV